MSERIKGQQAESIGEEDNCMWAFRGYHLDPAHFTTAMVHFYRGELARSNTWRTRLDATTNWAVVSAGAALTFVFGARDNPHFVLLLVFALLLTFLYIEARRYRYYVLWAYRVHLLETDFLAAMLAPPFRPSADWAGHLAETLLQPTFPIRRRSCTSLTRMPLSSSARQREYRDGVFVPSRHPVDARVQQRAKLCGLAPICNPLYNKTMGVS